jgi:hypothetical protein
MADSETPKRYKATIIISGVAKGMHVTREAVEGAAEQLATTPVPINIEHDPTKPPVGRVFAPELVERDDGELALEATMEIRESIPLVLVPVARYDEAEASLAAVEPQAGPIELDIDADSYENADLEAVRDALADAGEVDAHRNVARFSVLPDAVLYVAIGTPATATWWFARGFFTKLGEQAAESAGPDLAALYATFKQRVREMVSRRKPADQPPITIMRLELEREDGARVLVEGSTRAEGEELDEFFDGGSDLLKAARACMKIVDEPEKVRRLHFAWRRGAWQLRYGLDDQAYPMLAAAMPDDEFEKLVEQARSKLDISVEGSGSEATPPR